MVMGPYGCKSQIEIVTEQSVTIITIYIYTNYKVEVIFVCILNLYSDLKIQSCVCL